MTSDIRNRDRVIGNIAMFLIGTVSLMAEAVHAGKALAERTETTGRQAEEATQ